MGESRPKCLYIRKKQSLLTQCTFQSGTLPLGDSANRWQLTVLKPYVNELTIRTGVPVVAQWLTNIRTRRLGVRPLGLPRWVKDPALLWRRPAAIAPLDPGLGISICCTCGPRKDKKTKKTKKKQKTQNQKQNKNQNVHWQITYNKHIHQLARYA